MTDLYGYGPDCCGPDDSAYSNHPDPEGCLPLADAATGLTGPAANAQELTAGRPQEPRSEPAPAIPTPPKGSALRIDLKAGIVDLLSIPLNLLYGDRQGQGRVAGEEITWKDVGEYRRVLDLASNGRWCWSTTTVPGVAIINRLAMSGGTA